MRQSRARTMHFSNKLRSLLQALIIMTKRLYRIWIRGCFVLFFGLSIFIGFYDLWKVVQFSIPLMIFLLIKIVKKFQKRIIIDASLERYEKYILFPFITYYVCFLIWNLDYVKFVSIREITNFRELYWFLSRVMFIGEFEDQLALVFGYFVFGILWGTNMAIVFNVRNNKIALKETILGMLICSLYPIFIWALELNWHAVWVSKSVTEHGEYPVPHLTSNFIEFLLLTPFFYFLKSLWPKKFKKLFGVVGLGLGLLPFFKLARQFIPFFSTLGNSFALPANILQVYFLVMAFSIGEPLGKRINDFTYSKPVLSRIIRFISIVLCPS